MKNLFCFSCSNEEVQNEEVQSVESTEDYTQEFADLNTQLQAFNTQFLSDYSPNLRWGWKNWLTGAADVVGAVLGFNSGGLYGAAACGILNLQPFFTLNPA
jgi:hypothetical protein